MSPLRLVRRGNKQMAILWIRRSFIAWHKSYFTRKSSVGCEIGIIQKSLKEVVLGRLNTKNPLKSLYPTCVFNFLKGLIAYRIPSWTALASLFRKAVCLYWVLVSSSSSIAIGPGFIRIWLPPNRRSKAIMSNGRMHRHQAGFFLKNF